MECLTLHPEIQALLDRYETEPQHVLQVANLAAQLASTALLNPPLDGEERQLLEIASLLHDIGWAVVGPDGKRHHKESARLIRSVPWSGLNPIQVERVALTARYHRKALPSGKHADFIQLSPDDQLRIRRAASLLRVADGLDRRHIQRVDRVTVWDASDHLAVHLHSTDEVEAERLGGDRKADLLRELVPRPVLFLAP